MRSLYLRIYLTVVAVLALFALVSGWLVQSQLKEQRVSAETVLRERVQAWGDLLERALPDAAAPAEQQAEALREWSQRLRLPMALDDAAGRRIAASESFTRRQQGGGAGERTRSIRFDDGRTLWLARVNPLRTTGAAGAGPGGDRARPAPDLRPMWFNAVRSGSGGMGVALLLAVLFAAVALGAWPVVRRLTRRLEALQQGVEAFGAGNLQQRVAEDGKDEVAAVGASFNRAAARVEALLKSHQSLLANASHELRSPLARLKMAVAMNDEAAAPAQRAQLKREIDTNIAELDALVEEVLLASRLDAAAVLGRVEPVELLALLAEEGARVDAQVSGQPARLQGDERLLRRALRNLLENARRYGGGGGGDVEAHVEVQADAVEVQVCDRGPGVPAAYRERIFEAFFRLPGHAEREGGVGLGLSLVRQIAERHGGSVQCRPREGGGSCFVMRLPIAPIAPVAPAVPPAASAGAGV